MTPIGEYRPSRKLVAAFGAGIAGYLLSSVIGTASTIAQVEVRPLSLKAFRALSLVQDISWELNLCALALSGICFLVWLYRAFRNLRALGSDSTEMSPGRAVLGWFVPVYNVVHGYLTLHLLYLESQPRVTDRPRSARLVGWWWGIFTLRLLVDSVASDFQLSQTRAGRVWLLILGRSIYLAAAVMWVVVVRRIEQRQYEQHDDLVRRIPIEPPIDRLR